MCLRVDATKIGIPIDRWAGLVTEKQDICDDSRSITPGWWFTWTRLTNTANTIISSYIIIWTYIYIEMYMYASIYRYPLFRDDFPNQTSFSIVKWDPCDQHRVRRWGVVGREHASKVTTYPNAETRRQQTIQWHGRPFKHTIYNQSLVSSSKRS